MREVWLRIPESLKPSSEIASSLVRFDKLLLDSPSGIDMFRDRIPIVSSSGGDVRLCAISSEGDLKGLERSAEEGTVAARVVVGDRGGQVLAASAASAGADYVVVSCPDWKVIPWENLVAQVKGRSMLMAEVSDLREAELALGALELGVDGLVVPASQIEEALRVADYAKGARSAEVELRPAKVSLTKPLGMGLRACVDTCDYMSPGEGLLLGIQSSLLFLVEGEVHENPHVRPRPFRVNAGAVSNYVLAPNDETRYLSELCAGERVVVAGRAVARESIVGRVKVERRPLVLIEAELDGMAGKVILQDAETIRVVTPDGSRSVKELSKGDEVMVRSEVGGGGRHFGQRVEGESVDER